MRFDYWKVGSEGILVKLAVERLEWRGKPGQHDQDDQENDGMIVNVRNKHLAAFTSPVLSGIMPSVAGLREVGSTEGD